MTSSFDRAPRIETERLVLRAHTPDDLPVCAAMWSDADVVRYIGGRPFSREEVWARLLRYAGMWVVMGHGFWAIEEKASGRLVGEVGIMEARRDIEPSFEGEPEVGWALMPAAHGKGYASEAVAAALAWGDRHLEAAQMMCIISPENAPSIRLAVKFGFRERAQTTYHGSPTTEFERPRYGRAERND
jgi:RimJ/RimL family protein N-acetyltransferase